MTRLSSAATVVVIVLTAAGGARPAAQTAARGTIKGRIRLMGTPPGNTVIRMGMDPMCARANAGKRVVQEVVAAGADGGLANVFVKLQGSFPGAPVPAAPVTIDQRGCVYVPRVTGVQVGQTLQVRNSDSLLHNVHSLSDHGNAFNVGQPMAGIVSSFKMKDEEVMLRIKCDVHSWMTSYVGVVTHPYFAVSRDGGSFEIANVPAGAQTIQAWHERYGLLTQKATVKAGGTTTVDFVYKGTEKAPS
jgi:plastocyanin